MTELSKSFVLRRAAVDGKDGTSGQGAFKSIVFRRYASQPDAPTGGSYTSPVPTDWSDGIPAESSGLPCWLSTRIFTSDGKSPQTSVWTTPQKIADTGDIDFCFSAKESPSTPPDTHPTQDTEDWHDTATEADIWMAVAKCSNGTWDAWEVTKIKGEKGETGGTGEKGADGADGESAWSVKLSPEVLSFTADKDGTLDSASKTAAVALYYGNNLATISSLSVGGTNVGCSASTSGTTNCIIIPAKSLIDGTSKYVPATAGSATFKVTGSYTDADNVEHPVTDLEFSVQFTCDVHTSWGVLIANDETFSSQLTTVESAADKAQSAAEQAQNTADQAASDTSALKTSVSSIEQTAKEIKLQVAENTAYTNLIPNSWLNMVSNDYGNTCVRKVQLTAGTTYVLSVEGRTINAARLRCYINDADWTEQAYAQISSTSMVTATTTFTPKTTGTYYIGFYNRSGSDTQYYHVRRVKLEVAQMQDNDGNYIATGWCESEQDVNNANLIKKIVFPDKATVTGIDGASTTAYLVYSEDTSVTEYDGGTANYPAGASSELSELTAGETYTLSFFAKAKAEVTIKSFLYGTTTDGTRTVCQGAINSNANADISDLGDGQWETVVGTEWQRVSITFTTKTSLPASYRLLVCRNTSPSTPVWITDVKLEHGGRYTSQAVTPDDLLATGIDIKKGTITFTADNFNVQNNSGERTASIDAEGNLTVPTVRTQNTAQSAASASGYIIIHKNVLEAFSADGMKCVSLGVGDGGTGFLHIYNQAGRVAWGVDNGELIDYTKGAMVSLSNLQYVDSAGFTVDRLTTLINLVKQGKTASLDADENTALQDVARNLGGMDNNYRYYAPTSDNGTTFLADESRDLTAAQAKDYDQQIFDGRNIGSPVWDTTDKPTNILDTTLFDISPLVTTTTNSSGNTVVTFTWTIYNILTSSSGYYENKVAILGQFSYAATL